MLGPRLILHAGHLEFAFTFGFTFDLLVFVFWSYI